MLKGLIKHDIIIKVILPSKGPICRKLEDLSIEYEICNYQLSIYPPILDVLDAIKFIPRLVKQLSINYLAFFKLSKIVKNFAPNIIHTNVGPLHIGFRIAKVFNTKHVWHIREYQKSDFGMTPFPSINSYKDALNDAINYPVAITNSLYEYYNISNKGRVILNPIMFNLSEELNYNKEKFFFFAGRLDESKGILITINAYLKFSINNDDYKLLIAGDTNDKNFKKRIIKLINVHEKHENIVLLGSIDNIEDYLKRATAVIVASKCEGFGRVTAEANVSGCLVVGFNSCGTKEILKGGKLGLLFSSEAELVEILNRIAINGINYYHPIINEAYKEATEKYSISRHILSIRALYDHILLSSNDNL